MFTPKYLKDILAKIDDKKNKYIIIQGCYSGSFIATDNMILSKNTLTSISNICIMTAIRYDRPSFGCNPSPGRTHFGGTFNDLLKAQNARLEEINWGNFYKRINLEIEELESTMQIKTKYHSCPMYFNNIDILAK